MLPSKRLAFAFLAGAALTGAAAGFAMDRVIVGPRLAPRMRNAPRYQETLATRLYDYLNLTPEQRTAWDALLAERQRKNAAIDSAVQPQHDSIMKEYTVKHRELLTPEQIKKLDEYRQEQTRASEERQKNRNTPEKR